jgi:hypothetical protein
VCSITAQINSNSVTEVTNVSQIEPLLALGVFVSTAATDAVYVMFNASVSSNRRVPAASWSSVWYLLSAFAVISYTRNWMYVCFAAAGSWIGAYASMTLLRRPAPGTANSGSSDPHSSA